MPTKKCILAFWVSRWVSSAGCGNLPGFSHSWSNNHSSTSTLRQVGWFNLTCHPCFHGTLITELDVFKSVFYRGKLGENGGLPALKCKMFSKPPFLMMKKITRKFPSQTSLSLGVLETSSFGDSNDSEPRSWNKQDQTQLVDLILPELSVSHKFRV